jgi:hypothetical protein
LIHFLPNFTFSSLHKPNPSSTFYSKASWAKRRFANSFNPRERFEPTFLPFNLLRFIRMKGPGWLDRASFRLCIGRLSTFGQFFPDGFLLPWWEFWINFNKKRVGLHYMRFFPKPILLFIENIIVSE